MIDGNYEGRVIALFRGGRATEQHWREMVAAVRGAIPRDVRGIDEAIGEREPMIRREPAEVDQGSNDRAGGGKMKSIDLSPYCGADVCPEPVIRSGHRYATDGIVAVRVPAPGTADTGHIRAGLVALFAAPPCYVGEWMPLVQLAPGPRYSQSCPTCDSGVVVDPTSGQESRCKKCHGSGTISCASVILPGTTCIAVKYYRLIRKLPAVEVYVPQGKSCATLHFRCTGGEGRLAPLRL